MIGNNDPKLKTVQSKQKYPSNSACITPKPFATVDSTLGGKINQNLYIIQLLIFFTYINFWA